VLVDATGCGLPVPEPKECDCDSIPLPPFHIDPEPDAVEIIPEIIKAIDEGRDLIAGVNFDFNRSAIREDSESVLRTLGEALLLLPEIRMEIQGHTDSIASEAYNQGLSERRAQAVLDYLLETFPELQADHFVPVGLGELVPLRDNGTEEGRAANRRVQLAELEPVD
jgi:OOP family OmpA-OmpF porin